MAEARENQDDAFIEVNRYAVRRRTVVVVVSKYPLDSPSMVQAMGDMADDGNLPDLQFAKTEIASLGQPYHDAVGNHEISQTALPENGNRRSLRRTADHLAPHHGGGQMISH